MVHYPGLAQQKSAATIILVHLSYKRSNVCLLTRKSTPPPEIINAANYDTARFKLEARKRFTCVYFVTPVEYF